MNISATKEAGSKEVVVLHLDGQLDGQSYQELINKARELFDAGARDFLLDMGDLTYISSAGLVALHSIALLLRGEDVPDPEQGWSAYRSMGRSTESGLQAHLKLLNPRDEIKSVLDMVGFNHVFEVFDNREAALASF